MVDRIVPATTTAERTLVVDMISVEDAWPVVTEPFCQWVIEDDFCAGRPAFETAGAVLTKNVNPFEKMKLRLLNGSHSALAYLGLLRGHKTVAEAIRDPQIETFVTEMMEQEISDTLHVPTGVDLSLYRGALLERFRNPNLQHALAQIAMDGSQKLPQRILEPIRDRLEKGQSIARLAQVVAAWLRIIGTHDGTHFQYALRDPLASELRQSISMSNPSSTGLELILLQHRDVFGNDLATSSEFHDAVKQDYSI